MDPIMQRLYHLMCMGEWLGPIRVKIHGEMMMGQPWFL